MVSLITRVTVRQDLLEIAARLVGSGVFVAVRLQVVVVVIVVVA